jgi:hypothetical protein
MKKTLPDQKLLCKILYLILPHMSYQTKYQCKWIPLLNYLEFGEWPVVFHGTHAEVKKWITNW